MTTTIAFLFVAASQTFSLPVGLLSALCFVESRHNPAAMHYHDGQGHSVGICQIKLATARTIGFRGTEEQLKAPKVNIHYAAKYLHRQMDRYDGDIIRGVAAYNSGTYSPSRLGKPRNIKYVTKVIEAWSEGL